jgi:hypothetical protein
VTNSRKLFRALWGLAAVLLLALLGACGQATWRFAYSQAPAILLWRMDSFADLNDSQEELARERLQALHAWHRSTQLPEYAALLARLREQMPRNTTPEQMCRIWAELRPGLEALAERTVPMWAELGMSLTDAQLRYIEGRQARSNRDWRADFLDGSAEQRKEKRVEVAVGRLELVYGPLDEATKQTVARLLEASAFDPAATFAERVRRQQDLLATARRMQAEKMTATQAQEAVRGYIARLWNSPSASHRAYAQRITQSNCQFYAAVHNAMPQRQREAAVARLRGYESDLLALAAPR